MSCYALFRRKYTDWPKKLKETLGMHVSLVRNIKTISGDKFEAGLVMSIESVHRGALTLRTVGVPYGAPGSWIRKVHLRDVRLLPR
jgi:hypothetical protein